VCGKNAIDRTVTEKEVSFKASLHLDQFNHTLECLVVFGVAAQVMLKKLKRLTKFLKRYSRESQSLEGNR
jgi:hypothetical protein